MKPEASAPDTAVEDCQPPLKRPAFRNSSGLRVSVLLFCIFALLVYVPTALLKSYVPRTSGGESVVLPIQADLISHAGAGMPQATYSNSLEALDLAVARGFRKIEIDFEETRDGQIVAAHDWHQTYAELHPKVTWVPAAWAKWLRPSIPTHSQFMASPLRGGLTPVDAHSLARWLSTHPSVRIVTDIKGNNVNTLASLLMNYSIPIQQIIPQIYNRDELGPIRTLGFHDVIYTLYRDTGTPIADVISFAKKNDLAVTIHIARVSKELISSFHSVGVPIYVHTINNPSLANELLRWGAAGVYTDFLSTPRQTGSSE